LEIKWSLLFFPKGGRKRIRKKRRSAILIREEEKGELLRNDYKPF